VFDLIDARGAHEALFGHVLMKAFSQYLLASRRVSRLLQAVLRAGLVDDAATLACRFYGQDGASPHERVQLLQQYVREHKADLDDASVLQSVTFQ
jgi:hypothetical protein